MNFAIQKGPHDTGAWQLIERGEVELNDDWFEAFKKQLGVPEHWAEFWNRERKKNPDWPEQVPPPPVIDAKTMFWRMMRYVWPSITRDFQCQSNC